MSGSMDTTGGTSSPAPRLRLYLGILDLLGIRLLCVELGPRASNIVMTCSKQALWKRLREDTEVEMSVCDWSFDWKGKGKGNARLGKRGDWEMEGTEDGLKDDVILMSGQRLVSDSNAWFWNSGFEMTGKGRRVWV